LACYAAAAAGLYSAPFNRYFFITINALYARVIVRFAPPLVLFKGKMLELVNLFLYLINIIH
jgi:hypothetical protein